MDLLIFFLIVSHLNDRIMCTNIKRLYMTQSDAILSEEKDKLKKAPTSFQMLVAVLTHWLSICRNHL